MRSISTNLRYSIQIPLVFNIIGALSFPQALHAKFWLVGLIFNQEGEILAV